MKKPLLIILVVTANSICFGQQLVFDIQNKKISDFIKLENEYGSIKFQPATEFISGAGIAQPVIYRRKESKLPDLLTYYFFYESDSNIKSVLYEWDDTNFHGIKENEKKSKEEILSFLKKYTSIYDSLFQKFGASRHTGDLDTTLTTETKIHRIDTWNPNEKTEVILYIDLSSLYEKHGPITIGTVYHIRLEIRNIK